MRKLAVFMMTTLDGSFEGEGGSIDWHVVDEEFNDWAIRQLDSLDTIVLGRVTYELMASWWPTQEALEADPEVTKRMNAAEKVVCSRTLASADWENTRIAPDGVAELTVMKAGQGKDIVIFGSSRLCASLADAGLIDEYRLMVNPIVLGSGTPLFQGIAGQLDLNLQDVRTFGNGNVADVRTPARLIAARVLDRRGHDGSKAVCLEDTMSVARVTEISATSKTSFEDALKLGIDRANKTLRNVKGAWVKEQQVDVDGGAISSYRVNILVTFVLDD